MILITGATGQLGAATIQHLLKKTTSNNIVAFARDEQKAASLREKGIEVRIGNFNDSASLDNAMVGIDKVLLVSGTDVDRFQQHQNVINAAKKAGVKHIVYTSVSLNDINTSAIKSFMQSHFQTEDYIKELKLNYTLLRNTLYTDGFPFFAGEKALDNGIFLPSGEGKVPYALRDEMAEAAANVLIEDGHQNKTYNITGSDLYSYEDVARELSLLSDKTIQYTDINASTFSEQLKKFGVPEPVIFLVSGFSEDIKNKQFETISNDLENLLGRKPAALKDGLKAIYKF